MAYPRMNTQIFTGSGSWYCPPGVTKVLVWGMGGGAGGGGGANTANNTAGGSGGYGGCSTNLLPMIIDVVPDTTYTITIGAGGNGGTNTAGGSPGTAIGSAGGDTSFGALMVWKGAPTCLSTFANLAHYSTSSANFTVMTSGSFNVRLPQSTQATASNFSHAGVAGGSFSGLTAANGTMTVNARSGGLGAGGGAGRGIGGAGGNGGVADASDATAGTAAAANSGAGGGGGGGGRASAIAVQRNGGVGGAGGSGYMVITWPE